MSHRISLASVALRLLVAVTIGLGSAPAMACSIPVFRYALERWPADLFVAAVRSAAAPTAEDIAAIGWLEDQARANGGPSNIVVVRGEPATGSPPAVEIRSPGGRGEGAVIWRGDCVEARATLAAGPWREALVRRLAGGDAVIWLVLAGDDPTAAKQAADLLARELPRLAEETPLPRGIGLPGSELRLSVPLEIRFSVLTIPAADPGEPLLRATVLAGRSAGLPEQEQARPQESLVVPVFGRGRAAAVLPAANLEADQVAELTAFLCGACSCQVKQFNPGFDLLLPVDWETVLFGEDGETVSAAAAGGPVGSGLPEYLPIPSGRPRSSQASEAAVP
jgi:hypothetical protein